MRFRPEILSIFVIAIFSFDAFSQSRRVPPPDTKPNRVNQRPVELLATPTPKPDDDPNAFESEDIISVETRLVTMPVRVIDRKGRFVGGLVKENFSVFDDNTPQQIEHFQNESQPFTVALMLDMSYSTVFKIEEIQAAAIAFIDQLRPEDRVIVMSFDGDIHLHCGATSDRKEIYRAIRSTKISTGTSLYEAVDLVMNEQLRAIEGRKAIVLFSDGVDTTSRTSHDLKNLRDASEIDVLIYPIRYDTFADVQAMKNKPVIRMPDNGRQTTPPIGPSGSKFPFPMPGPMIMLPSDKGTSAEEYQFADEYLEQLAVRTGGRKFQASTLGNLNNAFRTIASELREYYSIGYYPSEDAKPGQTRKIKVKVDVENVAVRTRNTYVVPGSKVAFLK